MELTFGHVSFVGNEAVLLAAKYKWVKSRASEPNQSLFSWTQYGESLLTNPGKRGSWQEQIEIF